MRPRQRGVNRAEGTLSKRIEGMDARRKLFEDRSGPEKAQGEKAGEYKDRVKKHERIVERQIALTDAHREVLERRLEKRHEK